MFLKLYIPQNWELGPPFSKLRDVGGGGLNPPNHPPGYASGSENTVKMYINLLAPEFDI
jgi:hypothetical protein